MSQHVAHRHSDEINQLKAEVERLRHENMRLSTANEYAFGPSGELAKCRAEIERLRAELQDVKWQLLRAQRKLGYAEPEVARAALEGKT